MVKELVMKFQRRLPELDEEEIRSIFDILKEDKCGKKYELFLVH